MGGRKERRRVAHRAFRISPEVVIWDHIRKSCVLGNADQGQESAGRFHPEPVEPHDLQEAIEERGIPQSRMVGSGIVPRLGPGRGWVPGLPQIKVTRETCSFDHHYS